MSDTRYFNGTRNGHPYHAKVNLLPGDLFEVEIIHFHRASGEPFDSYIRNFPQTWRGPRAAVRAVLANPDNF